MPADDDRNRLVTANTGTSLWGNGSYAYDAMGNLTSRSLGVPPVDDGTVRSLPGRHLRASTSVTGQVDRLSFTFQGTTPKISVVTSNGLDHTVSYDAAGNETSYYAGRAYSPRNLLTTVTDTSAEGPPHQISYGYDYRGVRVSRTETPTDAGSANRYYFYTPELQLLSSTIDDSNNVWGQSAHILSAPLTMNREVVWFAGQPIAEYGPPRTPDSVTPLSTHHTSDTNTPANNLFYTFSDHLATPLIQTDPTTAIVWRAEHEPYGNVYLMRKGSRTDQPLRFPGQEAAMTWEGAEENYNVFRWYRAGWGRYTEVDPLLLTVVRGSIRSRKTDDAFRYVANNPLRFVDPRGLAKCASGACADCPSGKWTIADASATAMYEQWGAKVGTFTARCLGNSKKCSYWYWCIASGIGIELGVGATGGSAGGPIAPCKCAQDFTGESLGLSGSVGVGITGGGGGASLSHCTSGFLGAGLGLSAAFEGSHCNTYLIGCEGQ